MVDCGSAVPGGLEAGRRFAEITMGGLGSVAFTPVALEGRWFPGLTVVTDHPALACLASQYAGWQIKRDDYFAMASGPGRALIRAEDLYDDLDVDEHASAAVLCLETRDAPPAELAADVAERAGVKPRAPHAALRADGEPRRRRAGRGAHRRDRAAQAPRDRLRRPPRGERLRELPAAAGGGQRRRGDRPHERRGALRRPGELTVDAPDDELEAIVERVPSSASDDHGEPFGKVLEAPTGTSTRSIRSCSARPRSGS